MRAMFVEVLTISLFLSTAVAFPFPFLISMFGCRFLNGDHLLNATDENGHEWNQDIVPNNYLLRFHCSPGYKISGQKTVLCLMGQWASEFPTCVEQYCGQPPKIKNTRHYIYKNGKINPLIGSVVKYRCTRGFRLVNESDSTLNCTLKGDRVAWEGITPECVEKEICSDPGVPSDGRRVGNCCQVGDKLKFSCNEDYELSGENEIECLEGEVWSSPRPRCRHHNMSYCPDPPEIPNGSIIGYKTGDFYTIDDEASVKCDVGFSPVKGSTYLFCEEGGEWDTDFAKCKEKFCEVPALLGNGTIHLLEDANPTVFRFGFQITYECNPGFRLVGDSMRSCANNGWTGRAPYCEVIRCYDPGYPENGKRSGNSFEIGSKVVFSCLGGYYLIGSDERYCLPNGQWSGELAKCDTESNYCPDPGTPVNGWKSGNRYDQGDVVKFGCQPGFYIVGSEIRECQKNQTWTGEEPRCRGPHYFDDITDIAEKLTPISDPEIRYQKYGLNDSAEENVSNANILNNNYAGRIILYFLFDSSGSIGDKHFQTSIEFAKALVRTVGISLNGARAGAMTFSSTANIEFLPMRYDTTEGVLRGLDEIKMSVGGTATRKALEQLLTEVLPLSQGTFGRENVKSVVFLLTDGKANMAGDPEILAAQLIDAGVEIYCIGVTGDINQNSLHKMASTPIEEHVFILQNYESLSWLMQIIINGTIDYSECGLGMRKHPVAAARELIDDRGRVIGGREVAQPWPWMVALYIDKLLQCGGSIIDRYWILTAAHCLMKDKKVRPLDSVVVKLGLTNVKVKTNLQEFESERFVIHERFHDVSLDYDIALIKLQTPIQYNTFVRPICLPPKDLPPETTLYKKEENTYAIGWGYEKVLRPNEKVSLKTVSNLKELSLPIQSINDCKRSVQDPRVKFTDRMFCAGSGKGQADTCKGDSGGPLMQSQISTEKNMYWVQVGIISWGEGCGMIGSYAFNTHVSRLRDWIANKTNI